MWNVMIRAVVSFIWLPLKEKGLYIVGVRGRGLEGDPESGEVEVSYSQ